MPKKIKCSICQKSTFTRPERLAEMSQIQIDNYTCMQCRKGKNKRISILDKKAKTVSTISTDLTNTPVNDTDKTL